MTEHPRLGMQWIEVRAKSPASFSKEYSFASPRPRNLSKFHLERQRPTKLAMIRSFARSGDVVEAAALISVSLGT